MIEQVFAGPVRRTSRGAGCGTGCRSSGSGFRKTEIQSRNRHGEQPRNRARSQAAVATDPPALSSPRMSAAFSRRVPSGKRVRVSQGRPPSFRNTAGWVADSARTSAVAGAFGAAVQMPGIQYCGSTATITSGRTFRRTRAGRAVSTEMIRWLSEEPGGRGESSRVRGPPARTSAGIPCIASCQGSRDIPRTSASVLAARLRTQRGPKSVQGP